MKNQNNTVELSIIVDSNEIKEYGHDSKAFVEGHLGKEYKIRVENNSGDRVEAIIAVDGLSILNGKLADKDSQGYILSPYQSHEFEGWRISDNHVAKFKFGKKEDSYTKLTQDTDINCGVIAVKVYKEKIKQKDRLSELQDEINELKRNKKNTWDKDYTYPWIWPDDYHYPYKPYKPWRPYEPIWCSTVCGTSSNNCEGMGLTAYNMSTSSDTSPQKGVRSRAGGQMRSASVKSVSSINDEEFSLGTEYGEQSYSPITKVEFQRGELIADLSLYYSSKSGLKKLGVDFAPRVAVSFPQGFKNEQYCQPPKKK